MKLSELIAQIQQLTRLDGRWDDPNYLADLLVQLASYYATLGEFVAQAIQDQDLAERAYKIAREQNIVDFVAAGDSVTLAEHKAEIAISELKEEFFGRKYKARVLLIQRQSLDRTMDAIRSKLSYIKAERQSNG